MIIYSIMDKNLKEKIIALELDLLKPEVRASKAALSQLIADDFIEFGASGIRYDQQHTLLRLSEEDTPQFKACDFELRELSQDVVQLLYKASISRGSEEMVLYSLRSSIWKSTAGKWQMLFHQGTTCTPFPLFN